MIPEEIVNRIIEESDIVEVVSDFVKLSKKGKNYLGLCPFHNEKTPSFNVSFEKQIYKCFGCGKAGGAINFVMDMTGFQYPETLKYLANKFNIIIPTENIEKNKNSKKDLVLKCLDTAAIIYHKNLKNSKNKTISKYLVKRDFNYEMQEKFLLGYAPDSWDYILNLLKNEGFEEDIIIESGLVVQNEKGKLYDRYRNRLLFPIKNFVGKIVGFGGRDLGDDKNSAKYINSPMSIVYDKSKILYSLYEAKGQIRLNNYSILVEGYADTITLHKEGYTNTTATCGTALTLDQVILLKRYSTNIYLLFDGDIAGQNATAKALELTLKEGLNSKIIVLDKEDDPDSYLRTNGKLLFKNKIDKAFSFIEYFIYLFNSNSNKKSSPIEKSNLIRDLIKLVLIIPDKLQHQYLLEEIKDKLRLNNEQFVEVENIYNSNFNNTNEIIYENRELAIHQTNNKSSNYIKDIDKLLKQEEIIVFKFILDDSKYLNILNNEYLFTSESFNSDAAKLIYDNLNLLNLSKENNKNILFTIINNEIIDNNVKEILTNISLMSLEHSDSWSNFTNVENEFNLENYFRICVDKIILKSKKNEQLMLSELISQTSDIETKFELLSRKNQLDKEITKFIAIE